MSMLLTEEKSNSDGSWCMGKYLINTAEYPFFETNTTNELLSSLGHKDFFIGIKVTFNPFMTKLLQLSLMIYPVLNLGMQAELRPKCAECIM